MSSPRFDDMSQRDHGSGLLTRYNAETGEFEFIPDEELQAQKDAWWEAKGARWSQGGEEVKEAPLDERVDPADYEKP